MRVAIVNDLALATETLRRLLLELPDVRIAWTAIDGAEAVEKAKRDRPDLILMDMVMPVLDGAEATRRIMKESPCAIVVVTASIGGNAGRVYEALSAGALDATETPSIGPGWAAARAMLAKKIEQVRRLKGPDERAPTRAHPQAAPPRPDPPPRGFDSGVPIALLGSSTGGPQALAEVISDLPRDFPFAIVAVQHLDAAFVPGLVQWLGRETGRVVEVAHSGSMPRPSVLSIAAGNAHLRLGLRGRFEHSLEPAGSVHRPSVDELFLSAVESRVNPFVAVLLTGMGRDGADGLLALRRAGWQTIAQDRATSVVWGMPGAAVRIEAASLILPIQAIGAELMRCATNRRETS
ncbi:MAG: chemotaxis-specific protein-glutamate methyltransferase CheB [Phycisphaeraceae bacterium]|nr:chemotaxis-specific protein-glutamate methyltransferase CheB [Phycisphaeraceae bacterium]